MYFENKKRMKLKRLLILAVLPMMCLTAQAQNGKDNTPKKGDFTVAATVGYNSYTNVTAPSGLELNYEVQALTTNWQDKKLMVGFEAGWFFKDTWKLNLGGGLSFTNNPGYPAVPGTIDQTSGEINNGDMTGEIPNYRAVAKAQTFGYNVTVGIDRYYHIRKVPNLMVYGGIRAGFAYGQNQMKYDEETSMGKSVGETWNLRGAFTMGADYFVLPGVYFGIQVDPVAYTYNMTKINPQAGLSDLSADSHHFGFLAAPTIKIGFKF